MKTMVKVLHLSGYSILYTREVISSCAGYVSVKSDNYSDHGTHKKGAHYLSTAQFVELTGFNMEAN